jgi:hypothetical protein
MRDHTYRLITLSGHQLAHEIGGQTMLDGNWFVAARRLWDSPA